VTLSVTIRRRSYDMIVLRKTTLSILVIAGFFSLHSLLWYAQGAQT
jgi:hypothetical protein